MLVKIRDKSQVCVKIEGHTEYQNGKINDFNVHWGAKKMSEIENRHEFSAFIFMKPPLY